MKRSIGVTLTAVACGLGALLGILFAVAGVGGLLLNPPPATVGMPSLAPLVIAAVMTLAFSAWAVATMIGLWRLRNWARWSVVANSGLLVFMGISSGTLMAVIPLPTVPNAPDGMLQGVRMGMIGFNGVLAALGGFWLYYFNRASVKTQFSAANPIAEPSVRPLSISIIAIFLLVAGASGLMSVFMQIPAMLLGFTITGAPARVIYLAWCTGYAAVGFGLLRLKPASRIAAIALFGFAILNSLVFLSLPDTGQRITDMMREVPGQTAASLDLATGFTSGSFVRMSGLIGCLFSAIPIWFLGKRRNAFDAAADKPSPAG